MFQHSHRRTIRQFLLTLLFCVSSSVFANPTLLEDIATTTTPQGSDPAHFAEINGVLYFAATTRQSGSEVWATDGTDTWQVSDINPGSEGSNPDFFTAVGDALYFRANGPNWGGSYIGDALYRFDSSGLSFVDINPGNSSHPRFLTAIGDVLYFIAEGPDATGANIDFMLWKHDASGLSLVDVYPASNNRNLKFLTVQDNVLYFRAEGLDATGSNVGEELFKLDAHGVSLVDDINPGNDSSYPFQFKVVGDVLYFSARGTDDTGAYVGQELFKLDVNGVSLVVDINPGSGSSNPGQFTKVGDAMYFSANGSDAAGHDVGRELWRMDTTGLSVIDIYPGSIDSRPKYLTAVGDALYFQARGTKGVNNISVGYELWRHDANGLSLVDLSPGSSSSYPNYLTAFGDALYFAAEGYDVTGAYVGNELWKHDASGLTLIDINPGSNRSYPSYLTVVGDTLYFSAKGPDITGTNTGRELFKLDASGIELIDIQNDEAHSDASEFVEVNGTTYFSARSAANGRELWATDGTDTWLVADIILGTRSSYPNDLTAVGDAIYFSAFATDAAGVSLGRELWRFDATGVSLLEVNPGRSSSEPSNLTAVGDVLYFAARGPSVGRELWKVDAHGLSLVADIYPGTSSGEPGNLTVVGDILYFSANGVDATRGDGVGYELHKLDASGISLVADIIPGGSSSYPRNFTALGNVLYFSVDGGDATSTPVDRELWKLDATGVSLVADIFLGGDSGFPTDLTVVGDVLYFSAKGRDWTGAYVGRELWKYDSSGLHVVDVYHGGGSSTPDNLTAVGDTLYFSARGHDVTGAYVDNELWKYDASGLSLVADINPGASGSNLTDFTELGNMVYFIANDGISGEEIWKTDGTKVGTKVAFDLVPGSGSSLPKHLTAIGDKLYFSADDGVFGQEPWVYDTSTSSPSGTGRIGDFVWHDLNANGIQESSEPGLANVTVNLWQNCNSSSQLTTTTDSDGAFLFENLPVSDYQLEFVKPDGYTFSPSYAAGDYRIDSNANPLTGFGSCRFLADGQFRNGLDAGLFADSIGSIADTLSVVSAIYFPDEKKLWVRATSNAIPTGSSLINATMISNGVETELGQIGWKSDKGFYQQVFKNLTSVPDSLILTSELGGRVTVVVEGGGQGMGTDILSIVNAIYFSADDMLWIRASSTAESLGSSNITATVMMSGVETTLGPITWKADKNYYQQVFKNITMQPDSLILNSNLGGTATTVSFTIK